MKTILIVDDDKEIANLVSIYMLNEGFKIVLAYNGEQALIALEENAVSLIILDVMMPGIDGMEVCRKVRENRTIPILMLSAKTQDMDKVLGLITGADDYMIKPFNPLELAARVKSLLRRSFQYNTVPNRDAEHVLKIQALEINKANHKVTADGRDIPLTNREFEILYLLAVHPGRVFGAEEIFQLIWQENYYFSNNTVMVHISNLRDKLEKELGYKLIQTVWGVGYKIEK
ncbi:response regulator transcription factor [Paenibacillus qinlingensis]|uniref:DNA-binding response OmpR family regulator n=1 Tax=Paenibacillus qinlingensis TaxID=1837343 RepID=A0ABU1NTV6_9BACL|nr:response regulator transcription factor [Paenibacillus qinlingensis]MDR6550920.1 DNA-binding response OmpR family regulator [Paenibacillus qinlingensis]